MSHSSGTEDRLRRHYGYQCKATLKQQGSLVSLGGFLQSGPDPACIGLGSLGHRLSSAAVGGTCRLLSGPMLLQQLGSAALPVPPPLPSGGLGDALQLSDMVAVQPPLHRAVAWAACSS